MGGSASCDELGSASRDQKVCVASEPLACASRASQTHRNGRWIPLDSYERRAPSSCREAKNRTAWHPLGTWGAWLSVLGWSLPKSYCEHFKGARRTRSFRDHVHVHFHTGAALEKKKLRGSARGALGVGFSCPACRVVSGSFWEAARARCESRALRAARPTAWQAPWIPCGWSGNTPCRPFPRAVHRHPHHRL